MILTGRGVGAEEALQMGLCNRVCETGQAVHTALELARSLAEFPQRCMRADRTSSYEQWDLPLERALLEESRLGLAVIGSGETVQGATRFLEGKGRHGRF
jgi:enoyl-CoA hydratase